MKLSIIVPVYNAAPWLPRCLDSLLDQGLDASEYEIILVDDGSTDASPEILARYAADHPQIRVHTQENGGQWTARNTGLGLARGEWISFVDADDYLVRKGLSHLLPYCDAATDGVRFYSQLLTPGLTAREETFHSRDIAFRGDGRRFITAYGLEFFCWCWLYSKRFLDGHGIPNYLPCITIRNARTNAVSRKLQLKGFIFACWDTHRFPGLAKQGNCLARDEVHHVSTEDDIMRSMEAYWKVELLSEHYDVELFDSNETFASHTVQKGLLAGTVGRIMEENGCPVFLLPLDQGHWYAKIHLPASAL